MWVPECGAMHLRSAAYISALLLLLFLFFFDVIVSGKTLSTSSLLPGTTPNGPYGFSGHKHGMPFSFDIAGNSWVNEPNPYIIKNALKEGAFPFWNPYEGLGMPLIGNLNSEVFNPLKILLNLFPHPFFQDIFFLLRLFVMGLFTYLFLRESRLSSASSLFGASFFMLSGYSIWWINLHPLSTVMYIPAVFYFYERWRERKDTKSPFLMSLSLSFAFFAGKMPDVIMGLCLLFLYALWKGIREKRNHPPFHPLPSREGGKRTEAAEETNKVPSPLAGEGKGEGDIFRSMFREGGKVILVTISGMLMASAAILPFIELYARASPLARAMRTGAASHYIPLISSVSLFQPLFLGWPNYFYGSWLKWSPDVIMPHASMVIIVLSLYCVLNRRTLLETIPYLLFSAFIFSMAYGLFPNHLISRLPVFGSIEFLKYNAMLFFSFSVMSATAFNDLLSGEENRRRFSLSIAVVSLMMLAYFLALQSKSPIQMRDYIAKVFLLSLSGMVILALAFHFSKRMHIFGVLVFLFLIIELFLYMPRDHPDRFDPYISPPYLDVIKEKVPYRITGSGISVPPLVSDALGLQDIRGISVLLPGDYYLFSENLLGFSVPATNSPNPLFTATSPFIDLAGIKYILSHKPLEQWRLEEETRRHITSMRWIRFFEGMITHTIKGGAFYGFFDAGGDERFSFFFPMKFRFETRLRITEPFIFAGFSVKDAAGGAAPVIRMRIEDSVTEVVPVDGGWEDRWLDTSPYIGKTITLAIEGEGKGDGRIILGNFGPSPGHEKEKALLEDLLKLHKRELDSLEFKGVYEGIHMYENKNVMERAFILHKAEASKDLGDVIRRLQEGIDFRRIGLVTGIVPDRSGRMTEELFLDEKVAIAKYASNEIILNVESKGGLLVLSDLYYPGWKVRVNGKDEKLLKAFGVFRGVAVESGRSEVVFSYKPMSLYAGAVLSSAAFIIWAAYLPHRRRRR
jgi:hypothetical protein